MRRSVLFAAAVAATMCAAAMFLPSGGARAAGAAASNLAARCEKIRNDDHVYGYRPGFDAELRSAFARLFPGAEKPIGGAELRAETNIRCMGGRLYACFVGANLPCSKMNVDRRNVGASAYCKQNSNSAVVPMAATGHDAIFSYRCRGDRAVATGAIYKLDRRGFAANLWAPLD